jgi:glycosyltransferase involved in cell wall biosynthesis
MSAAGRNKRILFVDADAGRTGSTVSLEYLLRGFRSSGYEVFVLTPKRESKSISLLAENAVVIGVERWNLNSLGLSLHFSNTLSLFTWRGVVVMAKDIAKSFVVLRIVFRAIRDTGAVLVYANEYVLVQAYVAAALRRIPAVVHVRSPFIRGRFGLRRALLSRLILACSQAVIAITRIEAEQLRARDSDRGKIRVIGEFVPGGETGRLSPALCREEFGLPAMKKVVTMVGGFLRVKGTIDFLHAAERVARQSRDVHFVIAGTAARDGTAGVRQYYDACMKIAGELQSEGALTITGEITNSLHLIAASDIIVSPSPETHFSRPVVEAWAACKPVIAARTGHMGELIADGINGLLVDPGDDVALAGRIRRLLDSPELRDNLGREGKKKADAEFDAGKNVQRIVDICDGLIPYEASLT